MPRNVGGYFKSSENVASKRNNFPSSKKRGSIIEVSELVVPPLATSGYGFANNPTHMLLLDFSIVRTAHLHLSGNLTHSSTDLNNLLGSILMIVAFPYKDDECIAVYNHKGEKLALKITGA